MIGQHQLLRFANQIESLRGPLRCYGEFVLELQRALYGSETVGLSAADRVEVARFFKLRGGTGGRLRSVAARKRDGRL